jgi:hypothetical protein
MLTGVIHEPLLRIKRRLAFSRQDALIGAIGL